MNRVREQLAMATYPEVVASDQPEVYHPPRSSAWDLVHGQAPRGGGPQRPFTLRVEVFVPTNHPAYPSGVRPILVIAEVSYSGPAAKPEKKVRFASPIESVPEGKRSRRPRLRQITGSRLRRLLSGD